jgi:hypothetical protein
MLDPSGSLIRRALRGTRLVLVIVASLAWAARAGAQQPGPQPLEAPSHSPEFLTHYDFQLSGVSLAIDDKRFLWDTHFGGALDVIDYGIGRASIVADYEAVLGDELRAFDPNQGQYTLETSCSAWAGATEIAGVLHHVSRHLSDRPNTVAVAWNVLGARVLRRVSLGDTTLAVRAGAGRLIAHAFVDYSWTGDLDVVVRRRLNDRVGVYARGSGEAFGIDAARSNRHTQESGRIEGGVRVNGRAAALELFAGYERRADAYPLDQLTLRWALAGFRLVNK